MSKGFDISSYNSKRNFSKTSEPRGKVGKSDHLPRFCIQKHDASRLHYDFRLEVNGVLKSWAVPKGPSINTHQKRLAVRVEDHPLSYINFEGVIPEGSYGAGTVLVWDIGTYKNITEKNGKIRDMEEGIEKGHFIIELHGKKLKGGYAMTRMNAEKQQWLLVKMDDKKADMKQEPVDTLQNSAITGRSLKEISNAKADKQHTSSH